MSSPNNSQTLHNELKVKQLLQQACEESGLSDFGDESFVTALSKMVECMAKDADFHAVGFGEFKTDTLLKLVNRLRMQADIKRHPEILDEDVSDPIIIIGLPRSGTTKTQRMLGTDPNLLKTFTWQLVNPAPFQDAVPGQPDPRIAAACAGDWVPEGDSGVHAAHHMAAEQVEEDWELFSHCFNDWCHFMRNPSRSWHEWVLSRNEPPDIVNYEYARTVFQYLQWQQGGRRGRRWLMKSCGHLGQMEELITTFPKATLVHIHRHPATSVPSFAKILLEVGSLRVADLDPKFIGEMVFDWEKSSVARYLKDRDRLDLNERIYDVSYDQIRNDPMPVFREIYRLAGHTLTAESAQGMIQWEKSNEQDKHGKHVYSLEMFNLSVQKINDAFGSYIERFCNELNT